MRKAGLILLLVLAVGVAGLATAQAPTGDYASGFGYWQSNTPGSVGFEAIETLPDTGMAQGEFDYRAASRSGEGKGFHGDVICLKVSGSTAKFVVAITESTDGSSGLREATAQDNGDGRGDKFGMRQIDPDDYDPTDCDSGSETPYDIRGNIYVADNGVFARN